MFLSLSCTVEGGSGVSRTRNRKIPPQEGVCIFAVAAGVYVCCFVCSRSRKGVCDGEGQGQVRRLPFVSHGRGQSSSPRYRCMLDHVLHVACQVMSSCFFVFPVWLKVGVEHLAQGPDEFLPRKVCAFLLWL